MDSGRTSKNPPCGGFWNWRADQKGVSGGRLPVGAERVAHAQRFGGDIHQFVGGEFFGVFLESFAFMGLIGPFCLAGLRRTGYRKE
jgi:hypothetical protein